MTTMDEHDKRAREVVMDKHDYQAVNLLTKALQDLTSGDEARCLAAYDSIASALRSTAAAAVAAERDESERLRAALREIRDGGASSLTWAQHIATLALTPAAPLASPAQAERVSEDEIARVRRERDDALEERDTREDIITAALVDCLGLDPDDDLVSGIRDEQRGHRTEVERLTRERDAAAAETASRIAARLRARADEEQAGADAIRARWLEHGDQPGDGERLQCAEAVMAALRAEADALEVGT